MPVDEQSTSAVTNGTEAATDIEELIVAGDRAIVRWHYHWGPGPHAHVRGVDILEVRDGKISESLAYVKG